jgi:hypothetical protein
MTVFYCQFEAVVRHIKRTTQAQHLLTILQVQATNILYSVPSGLVYIDTVEVLNGCYRDHLLALAYRSQMKAMTQLSVESLQEFAQPLSSWLTSPLLG